LRNLVELAKTIATAAHAGQIDKAGVPYIEHPKYVAELVESDNEKIVAYLHDVLEDTDISKEYLSQRFPAYIIEALVALKLLDDEDYFDYIKRVKSNPLASSVKRMDLLHNMQLKRLSKPTIKDFLRIAKYEKAYAQLEQTNA